MNTEEKLEIALKLQKYHYFFRAFWDIGTPVFDDFADLDTAAISFNTEGDSINLLINKTFWNSLNDDTKLFLICHEMCHILFEHGYRFAEYINTDLFNVMNVAADVATNEILCNSFQFQRNSLDERLRDKGCWLDTVFDPKTVKAHESTEHYFNLLKKEEDEKKKNGNSKLSDLFSIDQHRVISDSDADEISKKLFESGVMDCIDDAFIKNLPKYIQESVKQKAGTGTGNWQSVNVTVKKKKKWETVIKKWEKKNTKEEIHNEERWERINPRYSQILTDKIHLPTESNIINEYKVNDKIDVFFFLDTSGSCISLKDRFFSAANSLDSKKFNIRLFCFDTHIEETSLASKKVYGGGGTTFHNIPIFINSLIAREKIAYPKAVFLISDGYGNDLHLESKYHKRWYWFLTTSFDNYIKGCHIHKLSEYE